MCALAGVRLFRVRAAHARVACVIRGRGACAREGCCVIPGSGSLRTRGLLRHPGRGSLRTRGLLRDPGRGACAREGCCVIRSGEPAAPAAVAAAPKLHRRPLLPAATPRMGRYAAWRSAPRGVEYDVLDQQHAPAGAFGTERSWTECPPEPGGFSMGQNSSANGRGLTEVRIARSAAAKPPMRGVAAGRSAQRGTSGAATGGGGPQAATTRMSSSPRVRRLPRP